MAITIIILAILGTVSVYGILGDNGLIAGSKKQQEQRNKELEEQRKRENEIKEQYDQTMENTGKELEKVWTKTISGNGEDKITDVIETTDGGYVVIGYSTSTDTGLFTNSGEADAFIVKYSADGEEAWHHSIGGTKADWFSGVIEINNEYIVVGSTLSDFFMTNKGETITRGNGSAAGIIAKYDTSGNEIWVKTEQNSGKSWDIREEDYEYILFTNIEKTDIGYSITGKLDYKDSPYNTCSLVILEYSNDNTLQSYAKLWKSDNSGTVTSYNSYEAKQGTAGIIYESSKYTLFGNNNTTSRLQRIQKANKKNEDINISRSSGRVGRIYNIISNAFYSSNGKIVMNLHSYTSDNPTLQAGGICIYDDSTERETWIEDANYKAITKVGNAAFATLKSNGSTTKLQKYATNGNIIAEYNVPNYDNLYKVGIEESYILTGNPDNETDVAKKDAQDAIISKYKLVNKQ